MPSLADLLGPTAVLDAVRTGRRFSTFVVRWAYLLFVAYLLWAAHQSFAGEFERTGKVVPLARLARFAEEFFQAYVVTQFLGVCVLTPVFTAGAITDEKERKTLDYLLATMLTAREILLGKLAARVGSVLMYVLIGLPVLAVVQFFGGVDPELLLVATALTLVTVVSLAGVSLLCSVLARRTREAVGLAYGVGFAYLIASAGWYHAAEEASTYARTTVDELLAASLPVAKVVAVGNPVTLIRRLNLRGSGVSLVGHEWDVAGYAIFHALVAVGAVAWGAARLRAAARAVGAPPRTRLMRVLTGERKAARRHPPVTDDPMFWKEVYVEPRAGRKTVARLGAVAVWGFAAWGLLAVLWDWYDRPWGVTSPIERFQRRFQPWVMGISGGVGMVILFRAAVTGAGAITREKEQDTATALLTTPLTAWAILWGKAWGGVLGQRSFLVLLGGAWAAGVVTGSVSVLGAVGFAVAFAAHLVAYTWLGLLCSVASRTTLYSMTTAVAGGVFLSGGFWALMCCCPFTWAGGGLLGGLPEGVAAAALSYGACLTPPFVLAGTAVRPDDVSDFFLGDHSRAIVPPAVFGASLAVLTWAAIAVGLVRATWVRFRQATAREE